MKTKKTKDWYNFENLEKMNVTKDVNSFMLKNDHSTNKLIFIEATIKQFIFRKKYDFFVQNVNLFKIYFRLLLRRIHASKIFFDSITIIKNNLFKTKTIMINCKFELNEITIYKIKKLIFMNEILESDKKKSKSKWSFVIQKKMQMIVFWIFLLKLKNQKIDIKSVKIKKWLKKTNILNVWLLILRSMYAFILQNKFHFACKKNFKLKILLRNIRSQMNLPWIWKCHFLQLSFFYMWKTFTNCDNWKIYTNCDRWKKFSTWFSCLRHDKSLKMKTKRSFDFKH